MIRRKDVENGFGLVSEMFHLPARQGMALKDKLPGMTDNEQYILLGEYGMLVKRPLIVADDFVLVGFREAEWSAALG